MGLCPSPGRPGGPGGPGGPGNAETPPEENCPKAEQNSTLPWQRLMMFKSDSFDGEEPLIIHHPTTRGRHSA